MNWQPISSDELWDKINSACAVMDVQQERLWQAIRVCPEKWALHPWGDLGDGFWVVAILGEMVIWYNGIEEGFNRSNYRKHGVIDQYRCNQDDLLESLQQVMNFIATGHDYGPFCSPPRPLSNDPV